MLTRSSVHLRREDRRHEQLPRRREVERGARVRILAAQAAQDRCAHGAPGAERRAEADAGSRPASPAPGRGDRAPGRSRSARPARAAKLELAQPRRSPPDLVGQPAGVGLRVASAARSPPGARGSRTRSRSPVPRPQRGRARASRAAARTRSRPPPRARAPPRAVVLRSAMSSAPVGVAHADVERAAQTTSSSQNANGSSCAIVPAARMRADSDDRSQAATRSATVARSSARARRQRALDAHGHGAMHRVAEQRARAAGLPRRAAGAARPRARRSTRSRSDRAGRARCRRASAVRGSAAPAAARAAPGFGAIAAAPLTGATSNRLS